MATKVKELDNRKEGDRRACALCNPPKRNEVRLDQVWAATLKYGGKSHRA